MQNPMLPTSSLAAPGQLECVAVTQPLDDPLGTGIGDRITHAIGREVFRRRGAAGLSQSALGQRMTDLGQAWSRTSVAKLEGGKRASISVAELLALALVFGVPPVTLIADPRSDLDVPLATGVDVSPWKALLWLIGSVQLDTLNASADSSAAQVIHDGYTIFDSVQGLERENPEDPKLTDENHRSLLRTIASRLHSLRRLGVPYPPIVPAWVYQRADELGVALPGGSADGG